jgi:hypothetical protein
MMRPLPLVPASTVLEVAEVDANHARRLEVWNYASGPLNTPELDYVTLSVASDEDSTPLCMITTRLFRKPDQLDGRRNGDRLVPATRLSILTVPARAIAFLVSGDIARIEKVDQLLDALSDDRRPWLPASVLIDGSPTDARALKWDGGTLWAGEYRDVTYSAIGYGPWATALALRSMDHSAVDELTR